MTVQEDVSSWIPVSVGIGVANNLIRNLPGRPRYRRRSLRRRKKR